VGGAHDVRGLVLALSRRGRRIAQVEAGGERNTHIFLYPILRQHVGITEAGEARGLNNTIFIK
jgi:hypothetical protein